MVSLIDHKTYLDDLVESFAAVLDLDITIINAKPLERVSGTGQYNRSELTTSDFSWNLSYTMRVIESGQSIVAIDTSEYTSRVPYQQDYYQYYSLILYPIFIDAEVIGVIVITSFNKKQQTLLIEKQGPLCDYLSRVAGLISTKLTQHELFSREASANRQLRSVMESVQDGLVLYNPEKGIVQINSSAKRYLQLDSDSQISAILASDLCSIAKEASRKKEVVRQEINRSDDNSLHSLIVEAHYIDDGEGGVVCVISSFTRLQDTIMQNVGAADAAENEIVASSQSMSELISKVKTSAKYNSNVLIRGEGGTGKELLARLIHQKSDRCDKPFLSINCAAIPESLLESEFFGYEEETLETKKGGKIGKLMLAQNGTLFLDEIGDMPLYLQDRLLQVLIERKLERAGGFTSVALDVRIIAATNQNLEMMVSSHEFCEELYYRLNVIPLYIPPLRERNDDILVLARYFINKYNKKLNRNVHWMTDEVTDLLVKYSWPGNVRELEKCIEHMVMFTQEADCGMDCVPAWLTHAALYTPNTILGRAGKETEPSKSLKSMVREYERHILLDMKRVFGNAPTPTQVQSICEILDISIATYYRKLSEQNRH